MKSFKKLTTLILIFTLSACASNNRMPEQSEVASPSSALEQEQDASSSTVEQEIEESYSDTQINFNDYIMEDFVISGVDLEPYLADVGDYLYPLQDEETGLYGYINNQGEWVIQPQYIEAGDFHGALASISTDSDKYTLIDKQGNIVLEMPEGYGLKSGFYVMDDLISINRIVMTDDQNYPPTYEIYDGFMDLSGHIVMYTSDISVDFFENGVATIEINGRFGAIDKENNLLFLLPEEVTFVGDYKEGLSRVCVSAGESEALYGYIDNTGKWIIEPQYTFGFDFKDHSAIVRIDDNKWGLIDNDGNWILEPHFEDIRHADISGAVSVKINGKWGILSKTSEWIIKPIFGNSLWFSDGLAAATMEVLEYGPQQPDMRIYGFINTKGNWVIQPQFINANRFKNGLARVVLPDQDIIDSDEFFMGDYSGYYGYIDFQGNWVSKKRVDDQHRRL